MAQLENLKRGALVAGIAPTGLVTILDLRWHGSSAAEVVYRDAAGQLGSQLLYRDNEPTLVVEQGGRPWSFDSDGGLFKLATEAKRIRLAYLFDPYLAVTTSSIDPLPHQITAVYGDMLSRQPLRFLLADDPGAGKTIMAGLLIRELIARGDLQRCLICCPGNLAEQWQDELSEKFQLPFEVITRDRIESSRTGNPYQEIDLVISRLDHMSRNEDIQGKLEQTDWDLVVCDEAHKMSASFFGSELKYTKRYRLGQLLSRLTRHFLLLTATPHNGKEEDFQLFMALIDGDRFEGKFRDGVHVADASDLMRRLTKEKLLTFDGTPLFPERRAYTVRYTLSESEAALYERVTTYVREEFNRADALENEGRKGTVGFALTILQRRLASSPEAIYQSLKRRRERLERRLEEERLLKRGSGAVIEPDRDLPALRAEDWDDLDDAPDSEIEATEEQVIDRATAAKTIEELQHEISDLAQIEAQALALRRSEADRKWSELADLLQDNPEMFDRQGHRRKMVIFTEHRDTLNYLHQRIATLLGRSEAVVVIHGGMGRQQRRTAQEMFTHDKSVDILLATDAAGEGINLQRAHLMVNYDLPWNPNRLEQRFGRIHRIGQTEVCHLWNLVAEETREGEVYLRLLDKLKVEREALGGAVFDVLGAAFQGHSLRDLLIEAVRYGDRPEIRARLGQKVDAVLDHENLRRLIEERALSQDTLDLSRVLAIRAEMERAQARRLQPFHVSAFFRHAFEHLGGAIRPREPQRFEITHVPALVRARDRQIGIGAAVLPRYERVTFDKAQRNVAGQPPAAMLCPGHPLLDSTIDLILERYAELLKRGAILIDRADVGTSARVLFILEHCVQDARIDRSGQRRVVSRRLQFIAIDKEGKAANAGPAPYLDYEPISEADRAICRRILEDEWLSGDLESPVISHAIAHIVPEHFDEVKQRREHLLNKTLAAVKDRLTKEIAYWDHRAQDLKAQEQAGRQPRMNWQRAHERADVLQTRLQRRLAEIEQERHLSAAPPIIVGGAIVIPQGLLDQLSGRRDDREASLFARQTKRIEDLAMNAVMQTERLLGHQPRDISADHCGYDIESLDGETGHLRFIEVKGRITGAETVTISRNEILTGLNKADQYILALVEVAGTEEHPLCTTRYVHQPFRTEIDLDVASQNYELSRLLQRANEPTGATPA